MEAILCVSMLLASINFSLIFSTFWPSGPNRKNLFNTKIVRVFLGSVLLGIFCITLNLLMTKNKRFIEVLVHEFGHSFVALADEYAYEGEEPNDFPLDVEPWPKNITTLVDFGSKWQDLMPIERTIVSKTDNDNLDTETIGLYEGAGCVLKGVYRPTPYCMMKTLKVPQFCPVCTRAIQQLIDFYTR